MSFKKTLKEWEKWVEEKITRPLGGDTLEAPEIRKAILKTLDGQLQERGYNRRSLPFNTLEISLLAETEDRQAILDDAFIAHERLQNDILTHLRAEHCETPEDLQVTVKLVEKGDSSWPHTAFHIVFKRRQAAVLPAVALGKIRLRVETGATANRQVTFSEPLIYLGRQAASQSNSSHAVRENHVVFLEQDDEINRSVSNRHAHIKRHPQTGEYLLFDDGSLNGTTILRDAKNIQVRPNGRGVALRTGDKIFLGKAGIAVEIPNP